MKPEDTDEAIKSAIQGDLERFMRDEPSIVGDVISGRNPSTPCVHDPVTCWWCQNPSVTPRVPYAKVEDCDG